MQWTFDYLSEVLQNVCFHETKTIAKFACTLASLWQLTLVYIDQICAKCASYNILL